MKSKSPISAIITFSIIVAIILVGIFAFKAITLNLNNNKNKEVITPAQKIITPPKAADETELVITENDIQKMIDQGGQEYLDKPTAKIESDGITVSGTGKVAVVSSNVKVKILPKVINEKITFELIEAKIGFINAPQWVIDKVNPMITKYLDENINSKGNISYFILETGKLTIRMKGVNP